MLRRPQQQLLLAFTSSDGLNATLFFRYRAYATALLCCTSCPANSLEQSRCEEATIVSAPLSWAVPNAACEWVCPEPACGLQLTAAYDANMHGAGEQQARLYIIDDHW
jgi:hypothetical protein